MTSSIPSGTFASAIATRACFPSPYAPYICTTHAMARTRQVREQIGDARDALDQSARRLLELRETDSDSGVCKRAREKKSADVLYCRATADRRDPSERAPYPVASAGPVLKKSGTWSLDKRQSRAVSRRGSSHHGPGASESYAHERPRLRFYWRAHAARVESVRRTCQLQGPAPTFEDQINLKLIPSRLSPHPQLMAAGLDLVRAVWLVPVFFWKAFY
jgi:hypothetical protein